MVEVHGCAVVDSWRLLLGSNGDVAMTGRELLQVRCMLGISQASCASMMGANTVSGTSGFTATDIQTAEGNLNTISNSALNVSAEKFLRPFLNSEGGVV